MRKCWHTWGSSKGGLQGYLRAVLQFLPRVCVGGYICSLWRRFLDLQSIGKGAPTGVWVLTPKRSQGSLPKRDGGFPTAAETDPHIPPSLPGPYTLVPAPPQGRVRSQQVRTTRGSELLDPQERPKREVVCLRGASYGYQSSLCPEQLASALILVVDNGSFCNVISHDYLRSPL